MTAASVTYDNSFAPLRDHHPWTLWAAQFLVQKFLDWETALPFRSVKFNVPRLDYQSQSPLHFSSISEVPHRNQTLEKKKKEIRHLIVFSLSIPWNFAIVTH